MKRLYLALFFCFLMAESVHCAGPSHVVSPAKSPTAASGVDTANDQRLQNATERLRKAEATLTPLQQELASLRTERESLEKEVDTLEKEWMDQIEKSFAIPPSNNPKRQSARRQTARALQAQAQLFCHAADLLASNALEKSRIDPEKLSLEEAARERNRCLSRLYQSKTACSQEASVSNDALLLEVSQLTERAWRDERGVVFALSAGAEKQPTSEQSTQIKKMVKILADHPELVVQVAFHSDSAMHSAAEQERINVWIDAWADNGIDRKRLNGETIGEAIPMISPGDRRNRTRNRRIEISFVSASMD